MQNPLVDQSEALGPGTPVKPVSCRTIRIACGCYRIDREVQLSRSKLTHTMSRVHSTRAMHRNSNEMDRAHLDLMTSSTDGPDIGAWPAKPDDDTSEDLITLVDVDTSLGFTVVVIEPPLRLTFLALVTGESHDHCMLPHVGDQWSALFAKPYEQVP